MVVKDLLLHKCPLQSRIASYHSLCWLRSLQQSHNLVGVAISNISQVRFFWKSFNKNWRLLLLKWKLDIFATVYKI